MNLLQMFYEDTDEVTVEYGLQQICELVGWTVFGLSAYFATYMIPTRQPPIPYQITAAGDVILDPALNHPKVNETFPDLALVLLAIVAPLVIQLMFALFVRGKKIDLHRTWCAHTSALGTTLCVTEVLKRYVGRLRPNTYEYCGFSLELLRCTDTDDDW
eukprot:CAMPEP_0113297968 /NCGR_PEP_ID=MMETSP0010_2-20120614/608_1 /TAXON_ID=216773 ORGANISM="Corethron hystrix, Strain 308" /NCGR_SAMPLE_ID=MMETSP0010_2 /ASSEMBLY_ACC=CAM_ASM_000155 /LENGTH=158 /DNA_ID=CAMNT_0000150943 /DNA_START=61 /DNA_END=534 /DNA_ORIENTATION=- /assembly_acc=CAM_ASM_000155